MKKKDVGCIVMGGYVNGYSIIQELYENKVCNIILIDYCKDSAYYSNKLQEKYLIGKSASSLLSMLENIHTRYEKLIMYPTQDIHLIHLSEIREKISSYCFLAFNADTVVEFQNKYIQYDFCEKNGIPYPKSVYINTDADLQKIRLLEFPVIVKPVIRDNLSCKVFRNVVLKTEQDITSLQKRILPLLPGNPFIASEVIPGSAENIYAYVAYRNKKGEILGEWTGKKLSQFPNDFGVFSSAKAEKNHIVLEQGRKLVHAMNLYGISEPEFKYDVRDGKYKLMEINLRPMMWHRVGALNGISLNYIQYQDAISMEIPVQTGKASYKSLHFVHLGYELLNLVSRKSYGRIFYRNIFRADKIALVLFDRKDMKPFCYSFFSILKKIFHKIKRDKI
jgi:predicted ATP-grasp superfamily ATP-dependent carboligase